MSIQNFFILAIHLEDTDHGDRERLRILLYINGVLDGAMYFKVILICQ